MQKTKDLVDEFLRESVAAERRRLRRTRVVVGTVLVVVSALAIAAGILAIREREQRIATGKERDRAIAAEQVAAVQTIQLLAKTAEAEIGRDPARGVGLALDALSFMENYPAIRRVEPINALRRALAAGPSLRVIRPDMLGIYDVSFSPDGRWLVAAGSRGLERWGLADENGQRLIGPDLLTDFGPARVVAFSPDADRPLLAAGRSEGTVTVGDLESAATALPGQQAWLLSLAWSPDGELLASGHERGLVQVWRRPQPGAEWGEPGVLKVAGEEVPYVTSLAFSRDGSLLAAGGYQSITLWPVDGLRSGVQPPARWVPCEGNWVHWLLWMPDGSLFTGYDRNLWWIEPSVRSPACERWDEEVLQALEIQGSFLTLSPTGRWLVSGGGDNQLRLLSPLSEQIELLRGHDLPVSAVAFSTSERLLASTSGDGTLRLWALAPDLREPQVYWDAGMTIAFDRNGDLLTAEPRADGLLVTALTQGQPVSRTLEAEDSSLLRQLALGPQARWLVATFRQESEEADRELRVWDLVGPANAPRLTIDGPAFTAWSLTPDGRLLALGYRDGTIGLWELGEEASLRQTLPCTGEEACTVKSLAFDAMGDLLAYGYASSDVYVMSLAGPPGGSQPLHFEGDPNRRLISIALSPDGRRLASGYDAGAVWLWAVDHPAQPPLELQGHQGSLSLLAFSPEEGRLAAAGNAGAVYLWDLEDPAQLPQVLEGHQGSILSLVFSADGRSLASAGDDRSARVWRVDEADLVEFAKRWVQP